MVIVLLILIILWIATGSYRSTRLNPGSEHNLTLPKEYKIVQYYPGSNLCLDSCDSERFDYTVANAIDKKQLINQLQRSFSEIGYNYQPAYPVITCNNQADAKKSKNNINPRNITNCYYNVEDYFYKNDKASEDCNVVTLLINDEQQKSNNISEFGLACQSNLKPRSENNQEPGYLQVKEFPIWLMKPFETSAIQDNVQTEYFQIPGITNETEVVSLIDQQMSANPQFVKGNNPETKDTADAYYEIKEEGCSLLVYVKPRHELSLSTVYLENRYGPGCRYYK